MAIPEPLCGLAELERRVVAGDKDAFGDLIRHYDHQLRGVVWTVLGSSTAIDDIMQTAYLKALRGIDSFDGRSSMKTWMHSICYRTAIDYSRHASLRQHQSLDGIERTAGLSSTESSAINRAEVESILASLSPAERGMLLLTLGFGYSYDDTAEIVGRKRGTVASTVNRVRKKLISRQATR